MGNRSLFTFGRRAVVTLAAVTSLLAAGSGLGEAAGSPGWRVTFTTGPVTDFTHNDGLLAVGPADAFADFAGCQSQCHRAFFAVSHWNGRSWRNLPWPASLHSYQQAIDVADGIGASSASDLWILKDNGRKAGVIRWNGRSWSVSALPSWSMRINGSGDFDVVPVVSGPRTAWLFSLGYLVGRTPTIAAREVNGKWEKVNLHAVPVSAIAAGPDDIWLTATKGDLQPAHPKWLLMHWDGHRWHSQAAPTLPEPRNAFGFTSVVALTGPDNVWAEASYVVGARTPVQRLLHWNGTKWSRVSSPPGVSFMNNFAPDGAGGLWVAGSGPAKAYRWYFYHYNGRHWFKVAVPWQGPATSGQISFLANVPGTTTMLAGGDLNLPKSSGVIGAAWQFGR
jgi:hypothetical protein